MPIYCYRCSRCNNKVEKIERYGECSIEECPECRGIMERIISPVGVIFKGSGFHINDYKSEGRRKEGTNESEAPSTDKDSAATECVSPDKAKSEDTGPAADKGEKTESTSSPVKEEKGKGKKKKEEVA